MECRLLLHRHREEPGDLPEPPAPAESSHGDPSAAAADSLRFVAIDLDNLRSAGITSALVSSRQGLFAGQAALVNLSSEDRSKTIVKAPAGLTVQFSAGTGGGGGYPGSLMGTVTFIRQRFYDAIHSRDQRQRYNRNKRGITRPEYDKQLAALEPVLAGEVPVIFRVTSDGDIHRAVTITEEFKLKPILTGTIYNTKLVALLKSKNIPVILSLDFPRRQTDLPDGEDEPLREIKARVEAPQGPAKLIQAGVRVAFSSGGLSPADFTRNIQRALQNGLSSSEALRALTSEPATLLGAGDQLGTIENGKIANLIVTRGELFSAGAAISHVFIDGVEMNLRAQEAERNRSATPRE